MKKMSSMKPMPSKTTKDSSKMGGSMMAKKPMAKKSSKSSKKY
jgi:hypothetical protein